MKYIKSIIARDLRILGKHFFTMILAPIIYLSFVSIVEPRTLSLLSLILASIVPILIFNLAVDTELEKHVSATALISATPILRKPQITARYISNLILFIYCCIIHVFVCLFVNTAYMPTLQHVVISFMIATCLLSIYMPIVIKCGIMGVRYFVAAFGFTPSIVFLLAPQLNKTLFTFKFNVFTTLVLLLLSMGLNSASLILSWKLFENKPLK